MARQSIRPPDDEFIEVEGLPTESSRKPIKSRSLRAWIAAERAESKHVKAEHDSEEEAERFYRAILQWKRRNPDRQIAAKRIGSDVYVWIPNPGTFGPFAQPAEAKTES